MQAISAAEARLALDVVEDREQREQLGLTEDADESQVARAETLQGECRTTNRLDGSGPILGSEQTISGNPT